MRHFRARMTENRSVGPRSPKRKLAGAFLKLSSVKKNPKRAGLGTISRLGPETAVVGGSGDGGAVSQANRQSSSRPVHNGFRLRLREAPRWVLDASDLVGDFSPSCHQAKAPGPLGDNLDDAG